MKLILNILQNYTPVRGLTIYMDDIIKLDVTYGIIIHYLRCTTQKHQPQPQLHRSSSCFLPSCLGPRFTSKTLIMGLLIHYLMHVVLPCSLSLMASAWSGTCFMNSKRGCRSRCTDRTAIDEFYYGFQYDADIPCIMRLRIYYLNL